MLYCHVPPHLDPRSALTDCATMLSHFLHPPLPPPQSWYPGHMTQFSRILPALLTRTDVVLELRDARLPLTSVNKNFEGKSLRHPSRREETPPHAPLRRR